jgi:dipeptidyl aminopeptidase/acylaminoacyl peptidase
VRDLYRGGPQLVLRFFRSWVLWVHESAMTKNKKTLLFPVAAISALWVTLIPNAALAQTAPPLSVENSLAMHYFGEISPIIFSPDGRSIAYMVLDNRRTKSEKPDAFVRTGIVSRAEGDIWVSNTLTGAAKNVTRGSGSNWEPSWSPDGRYVAFLSDRDGSGQAKLWLWDSSKDILRRISDTPIRAQRRNHIVWTRDSRFLLITTIPEGLSVDGYIKRVRAPATASEADTLAGPVPSVTLYRGDAASTTPRSVPIFNLDSLFLHDLALIDIANGRATAISRGRSIEAYALSPDGSHLVYSVPKRFYKPGSWRRVCDLVDVNLRTMQEGLLATDVVLNFFSWSPDGSAISYVTYGADDQSYEFYLATINSTGSRKLAAVAHKTSDGLWLSPIWDRESRYLYFVLDGALWRASISSGETAELCRIQSRTIEYVIANSDAQMMTSDRDNSILVLTHDADRKQDGFYRVDLATGQGEKLREEGQCYSCAWPAGNRGSFLTIASQDGRQLAYVAEDAQHASELWVSDSALRNPRQLTHLNLPFEPSKMGSARLVDWLSDDGDRLQGALLLPSDYHPGKKYPLIVWVYPGSKQSNNLDQFGFGEYLGPFNMQLFATRGYAVLFPDATEEAGDRMKGLLKSVLPGINKVIEMGVADPQSVGLMGHSQGGFAALALIVQTKRFKAALAVDGFGDFTAYYGALNKDGTSYEYAQAERQMGGTPWEYPATYVQQSPIYYLGRVETPLLLIHGAEDDEIPSFLSDEIFVGLHRLGKPVEYAKYGGEPHAPIDWSYASQSDLANRVISWFQRYLKDGK